MSEWGEAFGKLEPAWTPQTEWGRAFMAAGGNDPVEVARRSLAAQAACGPAAIALPSEHDPVARANEVSRQAWEIADQRLERICELQAEVRRLRTEVERWRCDFGKLCESAAAGMKAEAVALSKVEMPWPEHPACRHCGGGFMKEVLAVHEANCEMRPEVEMF